MNEGRIYRYKNLIDGIYESITYSMDCWMSNANKFKTQDFFVQQDRYRTLIKGAWLGFAHSY